MDAKLRQSRGNNEDDLSRQWKEILPSFSGSGTTGTLMVGDLDKSGGQWLGRSNTATYGVQTDVSRCLIRHREDEILRKENRGGERHPPFGGLRHGFRT